MEISISDPCICGSKVAVKDCCLKKVETIPPAPKTNYSHSKCYARALGDCSNTISNEHFLSEGVLDLFGKDGIVKTPFLGEEGKRLKLASLVSNVLCGRHNSALSRLDNVAKNYFEFLLCRTKNEFLLIRGTDLERWLLKFMLGLIATGHAQTPGGKLIAKTDPTQEMLSVLFGQSELLEDRGLVIPVGTNLSDHVHMTVLAAGARACGCAINFGYIQLMFFIESNALIFDKSDHYYHRPGSIGITVDGIYREVHFGWPEGRHVDLSVSTVL